MKELKVRDIMNREVHTLGRNDKLSIADDLMKQARIRHIPVLDKSGKLCGVVSQRDLFRGALLKALGYGSYLEDKMLDKLVVKEIMRDEIHAISPDEPISAAAKTMLANQIGCLPVVEDDKVVGIVSESDLVRLVASGA